MSLLEALTIVAPLTISGLFWCAGQARYDWGR